MNKKKINILFKILLILATILIISVLIIKRFLYFKPSRQFRKTGTIYKVFRLKHLYCWIYDKNQTDKIVIFCIDRIGNMSFYEKEFRDIIDLGYNLVTFDYSGFGKSSGVPSERRIFDDMSLLIQNMLTKYNSENIIITGKGLGSVVASYGARRHKLNKLILYNPILNIKEIFPSYVANIFKFLFNEFNIKTYLNGYLGKTILITENNVEKYDEIMEIISQKILVDKNNNVYKKIKNF